jgi:glycosyltransferase involved in cell wall biosynthesis
MAKKPKALSVVLATYNEEANIGRCLESVKNIASEIVVVDGQSTDETVAIAKRFGARVISTTNKPNFHINKNMAIDSAKEDWILQLDADEVVTPELSDEIKTVIVKNDSCDGYWVNRRNWFLTRFLTKGGQYPDPTLRLYKRGKGRLPAIDVHEQAHVDGSTGHLQHDLLHYRDTDFAKYLDGFNRYTSFIGIQLKDQQVTINVLNSVNYLFIKPPATFFLIYFRHRGYIDGFPGFIFALFSGLVHGVAFIKYWQITKFPDHD